MFTILGLIFGGKAENLCRRYALKKIIFFVQNYMNHFRPNFIHENLERSFSCIPTCIESFDDNQGCDSKLLLIMQL